MSSQGNSAVRTTPSQRAWFYPMVGALWLFVGFMLSGTSKASPAETGELAISRWLVGFRTPFGDAVSKVLEFFGGPECIPWVIVAIGIILFLFKRRVLGILCPLMIFGAWTPNHLLKGAVTRERPGAELMPLTTYADQHSFPSGHTAFAAAMAVFFVLAVTVWGVRRRWHVVVAVSYVVLMGIVRMYAAAHWLYDVVAGAFISGGTALLLWPLAEYIWRKAQAHGGFWAEPVADQPRTEVTSN